MHQYLHLVDSSNAFGNPEIATSTWNEESLNHDLGIVAKCSHALVWSKGTLTVLRGLGVQQDANSLPISANGGVEPCAI